MVDRRVKLGERSYVLYDWLSLNFRGDADVDIAKFCSWAENHTGEPYTTQHFREAVNELESHNLAQVKRESITLIALEMDTEKIDPGF